MSADHHVLSLQRRIRAFDHADDVRRRAFLQHDLCADRSRCTRQCERGRLLLLVDRGLGREHRCLLRWEDACTRCAAYLHGHDAGVGTQTVKTESGEHVGGVTLLVHKADGHSPLLASQRGLRAQRGCLRKGIILLGPLRQAAEHDHHCPLHIHRGVVVIVLGWHGQAVTGKDDGAADGARLRPCVGLVVCTQLPRDLGGLGLFEGDAGTFDDDVEDDGVLGSERRCRRHGERIAIALRTHGLDARIRKGLLDIRGCLFDTVCSRCTAGVFVRRKGPHMIKDTLSFRRRGRLRPDCQRCQQGKDSNEVLEGATELHGIGVVCLRVPKITHAFSDTLTGLRHGGVRRKLRCPTVPYVSAHADVHELPHER